ncbi:MAG TPA: ATP-binding cassette domain-containing protein, partial [Bacteroidales bacterium]|nr:ATP-binding cassette domain-containing protein [Bacteroidales bacterium]
MSEAILKALMQLFALMSDIHEDSVITSSERNIVRIFLLRHLNNELASRYMKMYKDYLTLFNSDKIAKGSIKDKKRTSLNAMRVLSVCEQINSELELKQKVYVFVKLADYVSNSENITETEQDFLQTVADSFSIPPEEYRNIISFIISSSNEKCDSQRLLIIGREEERGDGIKKMWIENMYGQILILHVPLLNSYLLRYKRQGFLYLNGQEIHDNETYFVDHGSSIRGEGIKTIFFSEIANMFSKSISGTNVVLGAGNVSFTFRNSTNGVHGLNFSVRSGELTGIIGGSGVGKSTTLSILNGSLRPHKGNVVLNGYDLYNDEDRSHLRGIIGFVPQDDLLFEELTVYQNLYYNARMCLSNLPAQKLEEAVAKIMADLDLTSVRDLKV